MSQGTKRPKDEISDEKITEIISKSIGQILRLSHNEDFRRKSFEMLKVSSTKEVEEQVSERLASILSEKNKSVGKKRKQECNFEHTTEIESTDLFSSVDIAEANDVADSVVSGEIVESTSKKEEDLSDLNEQNLDAAVVAYYVNSCENTSKETEIHHDNDTPPLVISDYEKGKNSQNSPLTQELLDKNWLKVSIKNSKEKQNENYFNEENNLIQVTDSNDFCLNSQISEDNYSQNLYDSQSFSQQEHFFSTTLSDSQDDGFHEQEFHEMFTSECQDYLNVNVNARQRNLY